MNRASSALLAAALLLASAGAAPAATLTDQLARVNRSAEEGRPLEALEALRSAELTLWKSMPDLSLRKSVLITEEPAFFGSYSEKADSRYRPGEPVLLYVEPVGYAFVEDGGLYRFRLTADFTLVDGTGQILGGQREFGKWEMASRSPATDFMMYFTFDFSGLTPGSYTIETTIRDGNSSRTLELSTPFTVVP